MLNILAQSMQGDAAQLGAGVIESVIGFIIVIAGIGILIGVLTLASLVITKVTNKKKQPKIEKAVAPQKKEATIPVQPKKETASEEVSDEVKAAIIAAIMAYYNVEKPKAEFTVKRIKRI